MSVLVVIDSQNYNGKTALIKYTPYSGGTPSNIGTYTIPYSYNTETPYGTYTLYFSEFDTTCSAVLNPEQICLGLALGSDGGGEGSTNVSILGNTAPINGRPAWTFTEPGGPTTSTLYYNGTDWVYEYPFGSPDPNYSFILPGSAGLPFPPEYTDPGDPIDCNLSVSNALCSLSYGACSTQPSLCFTIYYSEDSGVGSCLTPPFYVFNDRPYYRLFNIDCASPLLINGKNVWVYWDSTKWVAVSALGGNNPDSFTSVTILSELTSSIDGSYPVGGWTIIESGVYVIFSSLEVGTPTTACVTSQTCFGFGAEAGGAFIDLTISGNDTYQNGRPVYVVTSSITVRYDGTQWVIDSDIFGITPIPGSAGLVYPPIYTDPDFTNCMLTEGTLCRIIHGQCV